MSTVFSGNYFFDVIVSSVIVCDIFVAVIDDDIFVGDIVADIFADIIVGTVVVLLLLACSLMSCARDIQFISLNRKFGVLDCSRF